MCCNRVKCGSCWLQSSNRVLMSGAAIAHTSKRSPVMQPRPVSSLEKCREFSIQQLHPIMKKIFIVGCLSLLLVSCTATNPYRGEPGQNGKVAGFFNGFWDGAIAPITFIVSIFNHDVAVYNPNSSSWYTFGFLCGVGGFAGGSSSASRRK